MVDNNTNHTLSFISITLLHPLPNWSPSELFGGEIKWTSHHIETNIHSQYLQFSTSLSMDSERKPDSLSRTRTHTDTWRAYKSPTHWKKPHNLPQKWNSQVDAGYNCSYKSIHGCRGHFWVGKGVIHKGEKNLNKKNNFKFVSVYIIAGSTTSCCH